MTGAGWHVRRAFDPYADAGDPRLLLAFTTEGDLFGVGAHEQVVLQAGDGTSFPATKLEVVGVALEWQGRTFPMGERASDVLMSAVMTDVSSRLPPRAPRVTRISGASGPTSSSARAGEVSRRRGAAL